MIMNRCGWVNLNNKLYIDYHDNEWGVPKFDDNILFEMLILECFQAGLSWECVLNKRKYFKIAFDNFDYQKIANYDEEKVSLLLLNKDIIRNKRKILSCINNAKVYIKIQNEFGSFAKYIWGFTNNTVIRNNDDNIKTESELSRKIAYDLKKRGMRFVGPTIIYSYLQAIGIVNDHELKCDFYKNKV